MGFIGFIMGIIGGVLTYVSFMFFSTPDSASLSGCDHAAGFVLLCIGFAFLWGCYNVSIKPYLEEKKREREWERKWERERQEKEKKRIKEIQAEARLTPEEKAERKRQRSMLLMLLKMQLKMKEEKIREERRKNEELTNKANEGDPEAQFKLGVKMIGFPEDSYGIPHDEAEGMYWIEQAAGQGHKEAYKFLYNRRKQEKADEDKKQYERDLRQIQMELQRQFEMEVLADRTTDELAKKIRKGY